MFWQILTFLFFFAPLSCCCGFKILAHHIKQTNISGKGITWINVGPQSVFSAWNAKILAQAHINNITVSRSRQLFFFSCHGLFKAHLAWGKVSELFVAFYWSLARVWACRRVRLVEARRRSPLHSLSEHPPICPPDWLCGPGEDFHENIHRRLRIEASGTWRCGFSGVTAESMACLKLDNGVWPWTETVKA